MAYTRLIPNFKTIVIIEYDVATVDELKGSLDLPGHQLREENTLYVIRLKKAAQQGKKLILTTRWPTSYQTLVAQRKAYNFLYSPDDLELLKATAGKHQMPDNEIPMENPPEISVQRFKGYAEGLDQICREKISSQNVALGHANKSGEEEEGDCFDTLYYSPRNTR